MQWEGYKEQTIPAIPWWAGGQAPPRSICLCRSLYHPVCQSSPAGWDPRPCQPWPCSAGSRLQSPVCEGFFCFILLVHIAAFRVLLFSSAVALILSCASLSGCLA